MYDFYWDGFLALDFTDYCARVENNDLPPDSYLGCVRVGELCFDLVTREYSEDEGIVLTYDLYVGGACDGRVAGINDNLEPVAYGYSRLIPDYPYEYAEGSDFADTCISMTYEDFKTLAEAEFTKYINTSCYTNKYDLPAKARAQLKIW